jgi:hypothetical protein
MKTLIEHVENLSRFVPSTRTEILNVILVNDFIIDEDTLYCYCVDKMPWGTTLTVLYADGDGKKIEEWSRQIYKKNDCDRIQVFTTRWKAFCRRFKFKPV